MKQQLFTASTLDNALESLRHCGASITPSVKATIKSQKTDIIIGKFNPSPKCRDAFSIRKTPFDLLPMLMAEHPGTTAKDHAYLVFVCTGTKNDRELLTGLGVM